MSYQYGDIVSPYLEVSEPLTVEDQHFVDCVLNRTQPQTDGANGLAVVEVLEAAQRSVRERRAVRIDEVLAPGGSPGRWVGRLVGDQRHQRGRGRHSPAPLLREEATVMASRSTRRRP